LSHISGGRKKQKKPKKNKNKQKKTSVKHIRYHLIGGCVNKNTKRKTPPPPTTTKTTVILTELSMFCVRLSHFIIKFD